jgi:ATP-dependent Lon protease
MGFAATATIPIVPLAKDSVLLPSVTIRIPVLKRPDIPALLSSAFTRSSFSRNASTTLSIGCVPLNSPFLSRDGQQLIESPRGESGRRQERFDINPAKATKDDLFSYGTLAKIVGVQTQPGSEPYILVEGVQRFRINEISQERPYFEGEVTFYDDEGRFICPHVASSLTNDADPNLKDAELRTNFAQLKQRSRELLILLRLSSLFRHGC